MSSTALCGVRLLLSIFVSAFSPASLLPVTAAEPQAPELLVFSGDPSPIQGATSLGLLSLPVCNESGWFTYTAPNPLGVNRFNYALFTSDGSVRNKIVEEQQTYWTAPEPNPDGYPEKIYFSRVAGGFVNDANNLFVRCPTGSGFGLAWPVGIPLGASIWLSSGGEPTLITGRRGTACISDDLRAPGIPIIVAHTIPYFKGFLGSRFNNTGFYAFIGEIEDGWTTSGTRALYSGQGGGFSLINWSGATDGPVLASASGCEIARDVNIGYFVARGSGSSTDAIDHLYRFTGASAELVSGPATVGRAQYYVLSVDERGYGLIEGRTNAAPDFVYGLWEASPDSSGLRLIVPFNQEIATSAGALTILMRAGSIADVHSARRSAFFASYTGAGASTAALGMFQVETNGAVVRVFGLGQPVPGTPYFFDGKSASPVVNLLAMNASGTVAFTARFSGSVGLFGKNREGDAQLLLRVGDTLNVRGVSRTVSDISFDAASALNDEGVLHFLLRFTDSQNAIYRIRIERSVQLGQEYHWARNHDDNWHTVNGTTTNWKDEHGTVRPEPPGSGGNEKVLIRDSHVRISASSVAVGALEATGGSLTVGRKLTLNADATIDSLILEHDLAVNGNANLGGANKWRSGEIAVAQDKGVAISALDLETTDVHVLKGPGRLINASTGTLRQGNDISFRLSNAKIYNLGSYEVGSGEIRDATQDGPRSLFINEGKIRKFGPGTFTMGVEIQASDSGGVEVMEGTLRLTGPGSYSAGSGMTIAKGSTLQFSGRQDFPVDFLLQGGGAAEFQDIVYGNERPLASAPGTPVIFRGTQEIPGELRVRSDDALWLGGSLNGRLRADIRLELGGDVTAAGTFSSLLVAHQFNFQTATLRVAKSASLMCKLETLQKVHIELTDFSTLTLEGGSRFDGTTVVTQRLSAGSVEPTSLRFAGAEPHVIGGFVDVGTNIHVTLGENATVRFEGNAQMTIGSIDFLHDAGKLSLEGATVEGEGGTINYRAAIWSAGSIGRVRGEKNHFEQFRNILTIEGRETDARILRGTLQIDHLAAVHQRSPLTVDGGKVDLDAHWFLHKGPILGIGPQSQLSLRESGRLLVMGSDAPAYEISTSFSNDGVLEVGFAKPTSLLISGQAINVVDGVLMKGRYVLHGSQLDLTASGPIHTIGVNASIALVKKEDRNSIFFPLTLRTNFGVLQIVQSYNLPNHLYNEGAIRLNPSGKLSVGEGLQNWGEIPNLGEIEIGQDLVNNGTVAAGRLVARNIENGVGGSITGAVFPIHIECDRFRNYNGGVLSSDVTLKGTLENIGGRIEIATTGRGFLKVHGDFIQEPAGTLAIGIPSLDPETVSPIPVEVSGEAKLNGTLELILPERRPDSGPLVILKASKITGSFANVGPFGAILKDGRVISVSITPTAVVVFERGLGFREVMYGEWTMEALVGEPRKGLDDDPDGDGLSNREEWMIGTDPVDPTPGIPYWINENNGEITVTWPQSKTVPGLIILETAPTVNGPWTVNLIPPVKIGESPRNEVFQIKIPTLDRPTFWNFRYLEAP